MKLNVISCCLFPLQSKAQCTLTDYKDCKTCTVPFITVLCKYLSQLNKWLDCIWLTPACSDWHPQKDTTQRAAIRTSYQYSDRLTSIPILFAFNPTDPLTTPPVPLQLQVRVLHHISLKKCCKRQSTVCEFVISEEAVKLSGPRGQRESGPTSRLKARLFETQPDFIKYRDKEL